MYEINRELFEAWLFAQPRERVFRYWESSPKAPTGCLLCNFFRETQKEVIKRIGQASYKPENLERDIEIPDWVVKAIGFQMDRFTAGEVQDRYLKLFPNALCLPHNTEPVPLARSTQTTPQAAVR